MKSHDCANILQILQISHDEKPSPYGSDTHTHTYVFPIKRSGENNALTNIWHDFRTHTKTHAHTITLYFRAQSCQFPRPCVCVLVSKSVTHTRDACSTNGVTVNHAANICDALTENRCLHAESKQNANSLVMQAHGWWLLVWPAGLCENRSQ